MTEHALLGQAFPFRVLSEAAPVGAVPDGQVAFAHSPATVADDAAPSVLAESFANELAALREQARADGFAAGHREGMTDASVQIAVAVEQARAAAEATLADEQARVTSAGNALDAAAAALASVHAPSLDAMARTLADSAYALAEAVIGREVGGDGAAADAVRRALSLCPVDGPVTVRVHPQDLIVITGQGVPVPENVTLVGDPGVHLGGAVAAFGAYEVDAQIDSALARAKAVLGA